VDRAGDRAFSEPKVNGGYEQKSVINFEEFISETAWNPTFPDSLVGLLIRQSIFKCKVMVMVTSLLQNSRR